MQTVRVEVLGSLRAWIGADEAAIGPPLQRALLAMLALQAGQPVGRDELIDGIWGSHPPATAVNCVHSYMARLRLVLEPGRAARAPSTILPSTGRGYLLRLSPEQLDATVFGEHLRQARQLHAAGDAKKAAIALDTALALWHGAPLAGIPGPFAEAERARLTEEYLTAVEDRAGLMLAAGGPEQTVGHLARLVTEHPFRERLAGMYMLALFRRGRQAEALAVYQRTRRMLVDELGVEPGKELQRIHDGILNGRDHRAARGTGVLVPGRPGLGRVSAGQVIPGQLPPALPHFTGRQAELALLTGLATEAAPSRKGTVIMAISGTAGVGKTVLALRLAHDLAGSFPDGHLYVNLYGFGGSGRPAPPGSALHGFLRALGMPARQIPSRLDQQTAMYRSVLAGQRMLIVLDNAHDEEQVRPLLPGSAGCVVIVTSRRQLTGLAATDGAYQLGLELFTPTEGRDLLVRRLGRERVAAEPRAAADLVERCARLPLALSVVASRAAASPGRPLAALAAELRDIRAGLDALDTADTASSVRAAFAGSYQGLSQAAGRMFRLIGLHPGSDISVPAAASLAALPTSQARAALAELTRLNLVAESAQGRFTCHDLLRAYAAEQVAAADDEHERRAALHRMVDYYLHTARQGATLLDPTRDDVKPEPPVPGVALIHLADYRDALAWYEAELAVLLATAGVAAATGFDRHAWQLAWALTPVLFRRGHWHEWATMQTLALAAAQRLRDRPAQAWALLNLGHVHAVRGDTAEANPPLRQALRLYRRLGDKLGEASVYTALAVVLWGQHRYHRALDRIRESLALYEAAGNPPGHAYALGVAGWLHAQLGDHQQGLACGTRAIAVHREHGNPYGEADACQVVGHILHLAERHREAIACHERSAQLYQELGDLQHEAANLIELGDAQYAAGHSQASRDSWQHALAILEELNHPDASRIRTELLRGDLESRAGARIEGRDVVPGAARKVLWGIPADQSPAGTAAAESTSTATHRSGALVRWVPPQGTAYGHCARTQWCRGPQQR